MTTNILATRHALAGAALACLAAPKIAGAQPARRRLRLAVNSGLQVLDPIAGPFFATRNFAYMVYDTLVSLDNDGQVRPRVLEGWTVSADKLTYRFKLRPGLEWHDGAPAIADDCVASLQRCGTSDSSGRRLMAGTGNLAVISPTEFVLELARRFGGVVAALAKPSVQVRS